MNIIHKLIFTLSFFATAIASNSFAQTEFDYYEQLRIERKEKKIKTVSEFGTFNDALETKDYFDEEGYLRKREFYMTDMMGENIYVWKEISSIIYDDKGNMSGAETEFDSEKKKVFSHNFNLIKPSNFYDIGFGETTIVNVVYIFDKSYKLKEKDSYFDPEDIPGNQFEKEIFVYKNDKIIESKFYSQGSSSVSISKYSYNECGLLDNIHTSNDFQNEGRNYGSRYVYEFY